MDAVPAGCPLSKRQWQVLSELARGRTTATIAERMGLHVGTVLSHLHYAYPRIGASTRSQAIAIVHEAGWLDPVAEGPGDDRVTPGQRLYLDAFDDYLQHHADDEAQSRARERMDHHMQSMCFEADIPLPAGGKAQQPDGMKRLLALLS